MSSLDTSLLAGSYSRSTSVAAVSEMTPSNGTANIAPDVTISVDVIGIPDTADTEILLYDDDLGTLVVYSGGAFTAAVTGASVTLAGGVYTFEFVPDSDLPYRTTAEVGVYDIGVEIGISAFTIEVDPEVIAGWTDTQPIEAYLNTPLTSFPNMESYRTAMLAACTSDPLRTDIAAKRMAELLHLTELGDILAARNRYVVPQVTGTYKSTSTSSQTILNAARTYERYFTNGVDELALAGLGPFWTNLVLTHYKSASFPHRLSAVSLALHLAAILENNIA